MNEDRIKIILNELAEYQAHKDLINLQKQELVETILTPEIKAKIAEIESEFAGKSDIVDSAITKLTEQVKGLVLALGSSVKGDHLHAIFGKGRISWDAKGLDGFAVGHPEILYMRKEGDPSVSIRKT
jgi:hypothetical protein